MKTPLKSLLVLALLVAATGGTAWGVRAYERHQIGERAAAAVKPGDIEMFSATTCGICKQAKKWFGAHEIAFDSCEIDRDADCRKRFYALKGRGTPLIMVRGERQVGFDRERIASALERQTQ